MKNVLNIGLIGCGNIANACHLPSYERIDAARVAAVCDKNLDKAMAAAKRMGLDVRKAYTDYKEMLKNEKLDAVDICTPNYLHSIIAVEALESGVHVFTEKPDAVSVQEVQRMKEAADRNGKVLMAMRNNRFRGTARFLKQFALDGNLGDVYTARCAWRRRRGIPGKGGWFTNKELSGGGPLIDLGVHMMDLAIWIMGNPRPVAVSACTYNKFADNTTQADSEHAKFGEAKDDGVFDVEDMAFGFIRFDNGASMQIEFSWASNIEREAFFVDLRGDKAGAYLSANDETLKIFTDKYGKTVDFLPNTSRNPLGEHGVNIKHFIDVINGDAEPEFTPEQGVDMIKIIEAVYKSASCGREIRL